SSDRFLEGVRLEGTLTGTVIPTASDFPDLVVSSVTPSAASARFGDTLGLSWTVTNLGGADATGPWKDSIYLSKETTLGAGAIPLATLPANSPATLASGGQYAGATTVTLPLAQTLAEGTWYLLVQADSGAVVPDPDRSNNTLASAAL